MYLFMGNDEDLEKLDEMIREEEKKSPAKKVLVCPVCNSTDVVYYVGGELGYQYRCKNCGYVGAFILEK
jgi:transposase-like protein